MTANLVIIDEFGYQQFDRIEANLLFRVVNYRYLKGKSTAITTNKGIARWPSVLANDEVLAEAILDRLLHNAAALSFGASKMRLFIRFNSGAIGLNFVTSHACGTSRVALKPLFELPLRLSRSIA